MSNRPRTAGLPPKSVIVITGGTGYIGSHCVAKLLEHPNNYFIRACVRSDAKAAPLIEYVEGNFGKGRLETVLVEDMMKPGAYDRAIKDDVKGVVHVAADVSFQPHWDKVVEPTRQGLENLLNSIKKVPSVQRLVLTSSSVACGQPVAVPRSKFDPSKPLKTFTPDTWDEEMPKWTAEQTELQKQGKQKPEDQGKMTMACYATGKILAEKAAWKWIEDNDPKLTFTTVHPNATLGSPILKGGKASVPGDWIWDVYKGNSDVYGAVLPQWFSNVEDIATAHVAAIADDNVGNERILAFNGMFGWNDISRSLQKSFPDQKVAPLQQGDDDTVDGTRVENQRYDEICGGKLKSLDESLKGTIEGLIRTGAKQA